MVANFKVCTMSKKYFLFFLCTLLTLTTLKAQQPNIIVQVNVLPPYQQSILDYQSRPNQVVILLTNPYRTTYDLQLRATLKGDNGVVIRTKPDYKSPRPISIDMLQTIRLTAENITELFNLNTLEFTNVYSSDIIRNGTLPEGNYQLCVEIYEYRQGYSLGSVTCSNSFPVQSLEPPVIIKPMPDEMVNVTAPQNIVFSWTTPPSAPPSTEYVFKIVEIIGDRNPNDAIRSNTGINSIEEVVRTNVLLYGPGFPALVEGRKYAIQVTARDPFGKAIFRNSGKSEVQMFTYGSSGVTAMNDDRSNSRDNRKDQPQYATHTIKGTLQWAFKRSEEAFSNPATFTTTGGTKTPVDNSNIKLTNNTIATFALQANSPVSIYTGHNQVQASRPTLLGQIDPTLSFKLPGGTVTTSVPKAADVISSAGATSLDYSRETITADTGQQKYPLANTSVLVLAENVNMQRSMLGTSRTDEKGNFSLPFINPAYEGLTTCKYIVVSISSPDFETKEFKFPLSDLSNSNEINLGVQTVLAKTYRLAPTITIEKAEGASVESPRVVVRLYREAADIDNNGYLKEEGNLPAAARQAITIQGKKMIPVAVDSVQQSGLVSISGASLKFGFGKLFYKGRLYIEIESPSGQFTQRQVDLGVTDQQLPANQVVVVKPSYEIKLKFPAVQGQVMMYAGSSIVPVPGAILQVGYNEADVIAKNPGFITSLQVTSVPVSSLNTLAGKIAAGSSREGVISNAANAAPIHPVTMAAAAAPVNIAAPMMISTAPASANSSSASAFKYMPVMQPADESLSHTQLTDKGGAYTVKTDSSGQFYIGNLPLLKAGANFTLKLVSVPQQYKDMEVAPAEKSFQLAIAKGGVAFREFSIKPEVISIVGRAVNAQKIALPNARLHFKGSSSYFESGETGLFQTTYFAGKHTLIIEKEGYVAREESFEIITGTKNKGKNESAVPANAIKIDQTVAFTNSLQSSSTVQKALQQGQTFNAALFGNATPVVSAAAAATVSPQAAGFASMLTSSVHNNSYAVILPNTQDLGDVGFLLKKTGKVKFRVVDKDNNTTTIAGAVIQLFDTSYTTTASGTWQYEGFGGNATVTVTAPAGYVPLRTSVIIQENGVENEVLLKLEKGVKVYGKISSGSQSVPGARIQAEGFDYLQSTADASGNYELYLPPGEQVLKAARSGYLSKTETRTLQKGTALLLNFNLSNGGGRNISSLLGFEIELDQSVPDGTGEKWSGRFVNLKPVSDMFAVPDDVSITFSNIKVNFDGEGNATPQGNEVLTDAVNIPLKLFKFLPVSLAGSPVIKVTKAADGKGSITGRLQVDVNQIQGGRGFAFNKAAPLFVVPASSAGVSDVELFHAGASGNSAAAAMRLAQLAGSSASIDLYGFSVSLDLPKASLSNDGLTLAGAITTPALGPIAPIKVGIEALTINKDLRIQAVKISTGELPSMSIASWKAALHSLLFSESGFKLGGNITIALPASGTSSINFSNLSLSKEAIYGGQFSFPSDGINLFNIVKLAGGSNPLSFGRVGNTSVYSLSGSAAIRFDKLITQEIKIPLFQIQTDGRFMVQAPVNFNADMGFAKFNLQNLIVSTTAGQAPYIGLLGEFKSDLSVLKFNVADIRFKAKAGGGTEFSVGTIGAALDIPVMKAALQVSLQDNGFSGSGSLAIPSTPINADIGFHYYKIPGGVDVGASFKSGIVIPIGLVTIENVGGGFSYNTAAKSFMININGAASITGTGTAIRLNPIGLTVESGPVIKGYAGIEVASVFTLAKAQMELNIPAKNFVVTIAAELSPMQGLASSRVDGLLRISWDQQDPYVFLGCGMQTKMLGILDAYGEYALGFNIKNPRTRQDDISYFFRHLDDDLAAGTGTVFSGIYIHTGLKVGDRNKKYGFDIAIASAKFWYESNSEVLLFMNFANSQYKFKLKGGMSAGAELCAVGICVGASFDACYGFTGGRDAVRGWYVSGEAAGSFQAYLGGCDAGCNSIDFCWPWEGGAGARVCANAYASINISQKDGLSLSAGAGGNPNFNGCNY